MLNYKKTNKSSSKRSAFTLIELSIVLIIIGLLVAGITGGASLIKSAELRAVMAEARDYKTAANAFLVKYDNLPGDHDAIVGTAVAGNNNGTIDQYKDSVSEGPNALIALAGADMGGLAGASLTTIPEAAIDTAGWTFGSREEGKNVIFLTSASGTDVAATDDANIVTNVHTTKAGVTGNQAKAIDRKMDDDTYNTGSVRGTTIGLTTICTVGDAISAGCSLTFDL